jgi:hypothetical protein
MKKVFFLGIVLFFSSVALGQSRTEERTICKGTPVPQGYSIVGETSSRDCQSAWLVKRNKTPTLTNEFKSSVLPPKALEWQPFTSSKGDFSILMPGFPEGGATTVNNVSVDMYLVSVNKSAYVVISMPIETQDNQPASHDAFVKGFFDGIKNFVEAANNRNGGNENNF